MAKSRPNKSKKSILVKKSKSQPQSKGAAVPEKVSQEQISNEAQIAVHWKEEEYYEPSPGFVAQANLKDPAVNERFAEKNFPTCFEEYADMLTWYERWHTVLDESEPSLVDLTVPAVQA